MSDYGSRAYFARTFGNPTIAVPAVVLAALLLTFTPFLWLENFCSVEHSVPEIIKQSAKRSPGTKDREDKLKETKPYPFGRLTLANIIQPEDDGERGAKQADSTREKPSNWRREFLCGAKATDVAIVLLTLGLFFAGIWQSHSVFEANKVAKKAAGAAKDSAEVAKTTLIVTNRPWVAVDVNIGSDLVYDEQGDARVLIVFTLKNTGNSPAANVRVDAEIIPILGDSRPFQKAISERNKLQPVTIGDLGVTLFPGEVQSHAIDLPISRASVRSKNLCRLR